MLFHVTARHDVNNCGIYNETIRRGLQEFAPSIHQRCRELGVKVHFAVNGHPEHVYYLLVEADDLTTVCTLLCEIPIKQDFEIKPVRPLEVGV